MEFHVHTGVDGAISISDPFTRQNTVVSYTLEYSRRDVFDQRDLHLQSFYTSERSSLLQDYVLAAAL